MGRQITVDTAWRLGLALPGVEESTTYGTPALKVRGHVIACVPTNRAAEPGSLVVGVDPRDRADLLAADPAVYYLPDHYADYPFVLVRLSRVHVDALRDLLIAAHRRASAQPRRKPRARRRATR